LERGQRTQVDSGVLLLGKKVLSARAPVEGDEARGEKKKDVRGASERKGDVSEPTKNCRGKSLARKLARRRPTKRVEGGKRMGQNSESARKREKTSRPNPRSSKAPKQLTQKISKQPY